jgi:FkbM family methyltransferase
MSGASQRSFMQLVSSAQNQEDVMLWRSLRHVRDGFYIDVGAADPVSLSVTRVFYEQGWRGINLEPNAAYFATLHLARPRDINLPLGAGRESGQKTFYNVGDSGLSTFDPSVAARHKTGGWSVSEQVVETATLAEVCREHRPQGPIHFLKIDVEGTEHDVLAGADFAAFRPWIVLVEATAPLSQQESFADWEPLLLRNAYSFVWYDGLNRFYVSNEMKSQLEEHFRVQPNVFDDFVPSASLLERAERAEDSLRHANAQGAQTARETAETVRRLGEAMRQSDAAFADLSNQNANALRRVGELEAQLADVGANLVQMEHTANAAEAKLNAVLASKSWRMTAPYRYAAGLLKTGWASQPTTTGPQNTGAIGKEIARQVFHRGMRWLLRIPGMRRCFRLFKSIAPGPVEWLVLRFHAYEQRAAARQISPLLKQQELDDTLSAAALASLDLSDDEARIYRQISTRGVSARMLRRSPEPVPIQRYLVGNH